MRFWKRFVIVAAMTLGAPAVQAGSLQILTGGTSGVYYPVGLALQEILERDLPDLDFTVLSTQATVENLNMLQRGEGVLALAQGDILAEAQAGNPEAGFPSSRTNIRLVGAAYPNFIHVVAHRDGRIDTFEDLAGKRVSVGPARSGNELNARALLGAAGLSYADLLQVEYLHYGESVDLFLRGELDAVIISAGLGVAAVHEASQRADIRIVPIDPAIVEVHSRMFFPIEIPAESYLGQDEAVATAALNNFFVTTSEASEELVYSITKAIYENLAAIGEAHSAATVISREAALAARPIEVHPGALRYFREQGLAE